MYKSIANAHAQTELPYSGNLTMFILVYAQGNAKSVEVVTSPDDAISEQVTRSLLTQKYKPALCAGQPCEMQFPLRAELVTPYDGVVSDNVGGAGQPSNADPVVNTTSH